MTGQLFIRWKPKLAAEILTAIIVYGSAIGLVPSCFAMEGLVSLGTGEMTGVYFRVGKAICKIVDAALREQDIRCSPESTTGSVYNIGGIQSGELEFGLVQSDVQYAAYKGIGAWDGKPASDLRSVLSLYPELVTVVARADANIHRLADLVRKRINVGRRGTGSRATWDAIAELGQVNEGRLTELPAADTTSALCGGAIDASLLMIGHPSKLIKDQVAACPTNLVEITGQTIDKLIDANPFYVRGYIPAEFYELSANVPTFGSRATLVTSASADPRIVAAIAKAILSDVGELQSLHPALAGLKAEEMVKQGLTAPLHPAAATVYRELGLLK